MKKGQFVRFMFRVSVQGFKLALYKNKDGVLTVQVEKSGKVRGSQTKQFSSEEELQNWALTKSNKHLEYQPLTAE